MFMWVEEGRVPQQPADRPWPAYLCPRPEVLGSGVPVQALAQRVDALVRRHLTEEEDAVRLPQYLWFRTVIRQG